MPKKLRVELWKGYMSADGYEGNRRHQANTVSKKLAISLRMLGEGIGHRIGLSYEHRPSWRIEGRSGHGRDQYRLHYEGNTDDKRAKEAFVDDGMVWSRVREVSCGPQRQTVYNIEVEEDHSYVLDGIVVKNCTHHSRACGGKPRSDQLRSQPDFVLTWMTQCDVDNLIVENVPEFMEWGPLDDEGKPEKSKKGTYFRAWVNHIRDLGYNLKYDVLNCADYGDATTRKRFFLIASKVGLPEPQFPKPRYGKGTGRPWRSARECLDLSDTGKSIFNRKKPLAYNTLRRIAVGMAKYNGMDFLMDMLGSGESDNCRLRQLELPIPTQHAGGNRFALVMPFIVKPRNNNTVEDIDNPLSTITTSGARHMLCEPPIVDCIGHAGHAKPVAGPLGTQCTDDRYALATPILIGQQSCAAARSADEPVPTIATAGAIQVATPVILEMSRPGSPDSGHVKSSDSQMCTITTCDAMQMALPMLEDGRLIDIRIRMLKPSELAAAHSFPKDYILTGNRGEQIKQIGNSVPVRTASALCEQMLKKYIR